MMHLNYRCWALCGALLLTACGSTVRLDNVPVEDRSSNAGARQALGADASVVAKSTVTESAPTPVRDEAPVALARVVYFDYDSYVLKPEFQPMLEAHARYLRADKGRRLSLEGHTDERGGREYNLALGQRRADAVRRLLGLLGVSEAQMESISFGKEKPAVSGMTEDIMAQNRRVELNYR